MRTARSRPLCSTSDSIVKPLWLCSLVIGLLLSTVFVSGCSKKQEKRPPAPPIKVDVTAVERGDIRHHLRASGPLKYVATTTVSSEVTAQVKSIAVADFQSVTQGQLLLVFDETKIKETAIQTASSLKKHQATLEFNKTEWEKNKKLLETGAVSQTSYEQKLSEYEQSVGQVEEDRSVYAKAMDDLKKTRVKAPIAGRLSKRYVEKGDWVTEGTNLFQISDYRKIYLEAFLSDMDVAKLDVGKVLSEGVDAELNVDAYPGKKFKGRLIELEPVANQDRLFQVRIYVENPEMKLLQGMFARGRVAVNDTTGVIRIPLSALVQQVRKNRKNVVFVVDKDKKAKLTRVSIGTTNRLYAEVRDGLAPGDLVVVKGKEILVDGQPLELSQVPSQERNDVDRGPEH